MATAEALTCFVAVNENCYVTLYQETTNAAGQKAVKSMIRSGHREVQRTPDGKAIRLWVGDRFWCTPAQVRSWSLTREGAPLDRPLVTVVGNRTVEEAKAAEGPAPEAPVVKTPEAPVVKTPEAPVARRKPVEEPVKV